MTEPVQIHPELAGVLRLLQIAAEQCQPHLRAMILETMAVELPRVSALIPVAENKGQTNV